MTIVDTIDDEGNKVKVKLSILKNGKDDPQANYEKIEEDETLKNLAPHVDTIIYIEDVEEEKSPEQKYRELVCEKAIELRDHFFEKIDNDLEKCEDEGEKEFVVDSAANFLIYSLMRMYVIFGSSDEKIDKDADYIRDQIKSVTNREYEKRKNNK